MKNSSIYLWIVLLSFVGILIYLLSPILTPFLLAALIAYLGDPVVDKLETWKVPRALAVVIVFFSFFLGSALIVLVLIPMLDDQVTALVGNMPKYVDWFKDSLTPKIKEYLDINLSTLDLDGIQAALKDNLGSATSFFENVLAGLAKPANMIVTFGTYLFLIPVVAFYLLRDWDIMIAKISELIPRSVHATAIELARRCDNVLGGFLRGQMMVMLALGIIYAVGLSVMGLDLGIAIGLFAGVVSFVPYLGLILGIAVAGIMAVIQFQDWAHPLGVAVIFIVAQMIEGMFLTPKFVGDRTGLHPVAVLFAVLAGGQLFGFMGVLLALPVAALINVFLGYFKETYLESDMYRDYGENGRKLPDDQYINF